MRHKQVYNLKQIYNQTFYSKEEFLKWVEKYGNEGVELEWYYKEEDAETE